MSKAAENKLVAALGAKLAPLGPFRARPMFGGFGLYIDGVIFGLMAWDQVFLKVDDKNRPAFETAGSEPFRYATARGETTIASYWRCPEKILRDAGKLQAWAAEALAASKRAQKAKPVRRKSVGKPARSRNPFL
jgi:DNA transformation protein